MEEELEVHAGERIKSVREDLGETRRQNFSQTDMHDCLFYGTIEESLFMYTDLMDADFKNAKFINCIFAFCDMAGLKAEKAVFESCEFMGCNLRDADFNDAHFTEVVMASCSAINADFEDSIFENGSISGNFMWSKWRGVKLTDMAVEEKRILLMGSMGFPA